MSGDPCKNPGGFLLQLDQGVTPQAYRRYDVNVTRVGKARHPTVVQEHNLATLTHLCTPTVLVYLPSWTRYQLPAVPSTQGKIGASRGTRKKSGDGRRRFCLNNRVNLNPRSASDLIGGNSV